VFKYVAKNKYKNVCRGLFRPNFEYKKIGDLLLKKIEKKSQIYTKQNIFPFFSPIF
jgi:hypothetical protein